MATYQAPPPGGQPLEDPGRTMGIVGLVLAIFCSSGRPDRQHHRATTGRRTRASRTTSRWPASSWVHVLLVLGIIVNLTFCPE